MSAPICDTHTLPLFELPAHPGHAATAAATTPDAIDTVCEELRRLTLSPENADADRAASLLQQVQEMLQILKPPF